MIETWYVLEDGAYADPNEVAPDAMNVLRHKSGVAVAMRGQVPSTRGVDADAERARRGLMGGKISINEARATIGKPPVVETKEAKPTETKGGYTTRESKAR